MAPPQDTLKVTADVLRKAGNDIVGTADEASRDIRRHSGAEAGDDGANPALALTRAEAECEAGWEQALTVLAAKLATAGDNLVVNADAYTSTEQANSNLFQPR